MLSNEIKRPQQEAGAAQNEHRYRHFGDHQDAAESPAACRGPALCAHRLHD